MNTVYCQRGPNLEVFGPFRLYFDTGGTRARAGVACLTSIEYVGVRALPAMPVVPNIMERILSPPHDCGGDTSPDLPTALNEIQLVRMVFGDSVHHDPTPRRILIQKMLKVVSAIPVVVLTRGHAKWCVTALRSLLGHVGLHGLSAVVDTQGHAYLREDDFMICRRVKHELFTTFAVDDSEIEKHLFCVSLGISPVIYVDDNIEQFDSMRPDARSGQATILEVVLPSEGTGMDDACVTKIESMVRINHAQGLVIDFDCTLSVRHMYKMITDGRSNLCGTCQDL